MFLGFLKIYGEEKSKVKVKGLTLTFDFMWNHRRKRRDDISKIIFLETREKEKNFDIKIVIFREQLDLLWLSKSKDRKSPKLGVSVKILQLTCQTVSKSNKSPMHIRLMIRGLKRHQNWQISSSRFVVIALESWRPNSNWFWTTVGQRANQGLNLDENLKIRYPQKADWTSNPKKPNFLEYDLRSGRHPRLKISKNSWSNLGKMKNFPFLKL